MRAVIKTDSIKNPIAALAGMRSEIEVQIQELRERIANTQGRLELVSDGQVPKAEFVKRMAEWVDQQAADFESDALYSIGALRNRRAEQVHFGELTVRGGQVPGGAVAVANAGGLLCWLAGDVIKAKLAALIEGSQYPEGPPVAERDRIQTRLQAELDALELSEERLVMQAETLGFGLDRRPDCRPEIVLNLSLAENT